VIIKGLDSSGGIAKGWLTRAQFLTGAKQFLFSIASRLALGPTSLLSGGYWETFSFGIKQQGHEADHSPPFSAEVKNNGAIPSCAPTSS
jgi:hypothetical protein